MRILQIFRMHVGCPKLRKQRLVQSKKEERPTIHSKAVQYIQPEKLRM